MESALLPQPCASPPPPPPAGPCGSLKRRLARGYRAVKNILLQEISSETLSLSCAIGFGLGLFPIFG